jgi:hypothetical protein
MVPNYCSLSKQVQFLVVVRRVHAHSRRRSTPRSSSMLAERHAGVVAIFLQRGEFDNVRTTPLFFQQCLSIFFC